METVACQSHTPSSLMEYPSLVFVYHRLVPRKRWKWWSIKRNSLDIRPTQSSNHSLTQSQKMSTDTWCNTCTQQLSARLFKIPEIKGKRLAGQENLNLSAIFFTGGGGGQTQNIGKLGYKRGAPGIEAMGQKLAKTRDTNCKRTSKASPWPPVYSAWPWPIQQSLL